MTRLGIYGLVSHTRFLTVLIVLTQTVSTNCYQRPENVVAYVGESAIFNCSLELPEEGERNGTYGFIWIKEDEEIYTYNGTQYTQISERYQGRLFPVSSDHWYGEASINLTHIQISDQGHYECKVMPSTSEKNGTRFRLEVLSPPDITSDDLRYASLNDTITIECKAKVTTHSDIIWYKDNNLLESSATVGGLNRGERLFISKVRLEDIGNYTCLVLITGKDTSHTTRIMLAQSAVIMVGPKNRTLLEGEKAMFECQVKAVPENFTVKWFRDGILVDEFAGLKGRAIKRSDEFLIINPVNENDSGQYLCEVSNGFGEPQSASVYLNVEYPAKVTFKPSVQYLPLGFAGVVNCYLKANPPMESVWWTKNNSFLATDLMCDTVYMNNGSLFFTEVKPGHRGLYSCTPYNYHGTQGGSGNMEVLVAKPPTFTIRPKDVYQGKLGESVEMHCDAHKGEEWTEQPTIKWHRKSGTPLPRNRVRLAGGNITIEDLRKPDFDFYQCVASNEVATIVRETQLVMEDETSEWSTVPVVAFGSTEITVSRLNPSTMSEFHAVGKNGPSIESIQSTVTIRTLGYVPDFPRHLFDLKGKIMGGRDATIEEFPYQLSFDFNGRRNCGASLIKQNVAVTAAHCTEGVHEYIEHMSIRTGSSLRETGGQVARVVSICDHPKYNFPDYDVSVLLLDRSFTLGAGTQLISLQSINSEISSETLATVTGWGALSSGGGTVLKAVEVPKVSDISCAAEYPLRDITSRMTCFGYDQGGKDSCHCDSGGPLAVGGKLVGVVSWRAGCDSPNKPGVYAKVSDPEIHNHINSCIADFF